LLGVVLGIAVAELTPLICGGGYASLAFATFAAMALARALGGEALVVAQASAGSILTVAIADGHTGFDRIWGALIGAGVAPPDPDAPFGFLSRLARRIQVLVRGRRRQ